MLGAARPGAMIITVKVIFLLNRITAFAFAPALKRRF
jgi:hypothetical protein